jgi:hypothetical protein
MISADDGTLAALLILPREYTLVSMWKWDIDMMVGHVEDNCRAREERIEAGRRILENVVAMVDNQGFVVSRWEKFLFEYDGVMVV